MKFNEYYNKLKTQIKKRRKLERKAGKSSMHNTGIRLPKNYTGDNNYVNNPPRETPPSYTPTSGNSSWIN